MNIVWTPIRIFVAVTLGFSTCVLSSKLLQAQEAPKEIGAKECAACHSQPSPLYQELGVTQFIRLVEASEWFARDKHAYAYQMVCWDYTSADDAAPACDELRASNLQSQKICENLGWKKDDGNFEKQCLTCHAGINPKIPMDVHRQASLRFGVQCEACHGPGSIYTQLNHHQQSTWRTKSPTDKKNLGMNELGSPSVAARVCFSCHVGDLGQDRFVTHAMYAAGHPPLPPVDLQIFMDAMPPHWQPIREKFTPSRVDGKLVEKFDFQTQYVQQRFGAKDYSIEDHSKWLASYPATRLSRIGAQTVHDLGIELTMALAERSELWGDFAAYDCLGCHHDLSTSAPRYRAPDRTPGRAYPASWWMLGRDGYLRDAKTEEQSFTREFLTAFDRIPFGDRTWLVAKQAEHLKILQERGEQRRVDEGQPMTEQQVREWINFLYTSREPEFGDYWLAKQTAWMMTVAMRELVDRQALPAEPTQQILKELDQELELDIASEQRTSVLDGQARILQRAQTFPVSRCRDLMKQLSDLASTVK